MRLDQQVYGRLVCSSWVKTRGLALGLWAVTMLGPAAAQAQSAGGTSLSTQSAASSTVSFGVWLGALTSLLGTTSAPAIEPEYARFAAEHGFASEDPKLKQDYRRLRLLFEALRDGGFWHLRWDVTDKDPSSRFIWKAWLRNDVKSAFAAPSTTAECDESSALFGMLARHLHVYNVGLYYPTWNHTIAVWAPLEGKTKKTLIQLPTTQIFLECDAGFDKTSFPMGLKNIERYPNWDVRADTQIPSVRAEWLLHQIRAYAPASPELWSLMRAKRAYAMRSSMGSCKEARAAWYQHVKARMTAGDVSALRSLANEELQLAEPENALDWLKE
jgi:hypothetical protein